MRKIRRDSILVIFLVWFQIPKYLPAKRNVALHELVNPTPQIRGQRNKLDISLLEARRVGRVWLSTQVGANE